MDSDFEKEINNALDEEKLPFEEKSNEIKNDNNDNKKKNNNKGIIIFMIILIVIVIGIVCYLIFNKPTEEVKQDSNQQTETKNNNESNSDEVLDNDNKNENVDDDEEYYKCGKLYEGHYFNYYVEGCYDMATYVSAWYTKDNKLIVDGSFESSTLDSYLYVISIDDKIAKKYDTSGNVLLEKEYKEYDIFKVIINYLIAFKDNQLLVINIDTNEIIKVEQWDEKYELNYGLSWYYDKNSSITEINNIKLNEGIHLITRSRCSDGIDITSVDYYINLKTKKITIIPMGYVECY